MDKNDTFKYTIMMIILVAMSLAAGDYGEQINTVNSAIKDS
jgi:hypothetical protein